MDIQWMIGWWKLGSGSLWPLRGTSQVAVSGPGGQV